MEGIHPPCERIYEASEISGGQKRNRIAALQSNFSKYVRCTIPLSVLRSDNIQYKAVYKNLYGNPIKRDDGVNHMKTLLLAGS